MDLSVEPCPLSNCDVSASFLQSGFWAGFKADFGWKPSPFLLDDGRGGRHPFLVLEKRLGGGMAFAYSAHGPELDEAAAGQGGEEGAGLFLEELAGAVRPSLSPASLFLRFDPPWYLAEAAGIEEGGLRAAPRRPGFSGRLRRAAADVQPPDTVLLDLGRDEEGLLAGMKPKWRYNIRLSEKKGVVVRESRADGDWQDALANFYALYRETSERDKIALHPEAYYRRLFEHAAASAGAKKPDLRVWTALHEGRPLASIITIFWGVQAVYLYGASSNEKRSLMPAYALQWAAIRGAKEAGCGFYDFYGIPPTEDPDHAMAGLYRFKTGFGGTIIHRAGSWDFPLRPLLYAGFRKAEAARAWYYKDFKKRKTQA